MTREPKAGITLAQATLLLIAMIALIFALDVIPRARDENYAWLIRNNQTLDPELGFFPLPNKHYSWTDPHGNFENVSTNEMGFRGRAFASQKKGKRVLLLGSSMVFGYGVQEDETIGAQLQEIYDRENYPAEVLNAGIKCFSNDQTYKLLTSRLFKLKPDRIVWFLTADNFSKNVDIDVSLYDYNATNDQLVERKLESSLFYLSSQFVLRFNENQKFSIIDMLFTMANESMARLNGFFEGESKLNKFRIFSEQISKSDLDNSVQTTFVVLPDRYRRNHLSRLSQYSTLPIIDLNDEGSFRKNWEHLFLNDDFHLSKTGNLEVAKFVRNLSE